MGSSCSCMNEDDKHNDVLGEKLLQDKKKDNRIKKLLLLGAGGSGKSTFFKQLQNIHGSGFSDKDRLSFKSHVHHQVIEQMKRLISRAQEYSSEYPDEYGDCKIGSNALEAVEYFELLRDDTALNEDIANKVEILWNDTGIRNTFAKRARFGVVDSSKHFFTDIRRISSPNYIPSPDDILYVRHRTTGVVDKLFSIQNTKLRIFDVGGQRAERKKWIHCFEHVTAVIYVASLSGYDESMYEEETENVMHDSLNLFEEMCNNKFFVDTSMILFLNKSDLFKEKIKNVPLTICFDDYKGGPNFDEALKRIKDEFLARNQNKNKQIYIHVTCATDPNNVERVFNDVQHIVIENSLDAGGLL